MKAIPLNLNATELIVNMTDSLRPSYDIPGMIARIKEAGRVVEPIHIRMEDKLVLRGKRRVVAVLEMLRDPNLDATLREAITRLDCLAYKGLTDEQCQELVVCVCCGAPPLPIKHIVVRGNLFEGFMHFGPFDTFEIAKAWAKERFKDDNWCIMPLHEV